jgi:hypothetical protein
MYSSPGRGPAIPNNREKPSQEELSYWTFLKTFKISRSLRLLGIIVFSKRLMSKSSILQLTLTLKLKAKIRDLPTLPQPLHSVDTEQPHSKTISDAAGTRVSEGFLTAEEKAAVEAMFRVEGLVNLLHKQLPAGELSDGSKCKIADKMTAVFSERKECSKEAVPQTKEDGASGQGRAVLVARRKGNKIGEGGDPSGREGSQVQAASGSGDSGREIESRGGVISGEVRELQQLDRAESGRQQNGGEALPLDGMNSSVDLRGEGKGTGGPGGDGNQGAGSENGENNLNAFKLQTPCRTCVCGP